MKNLFATLPAEVQESIEKIAKSDLALSRKGPNFEIGIVGTKYGFVTLSYVRKNMYQLTGNHGAYTFTGTAQETMIELTRQVYDLEVAE